MTQSPTTAPPLSYQGPREVLINQPVTISGRFDPQRIAKVALIAEDKYPLPVTSDSKTGQWQVKLDRGFNQAGSRWLRLRGSDAAGKALVSQIFYLTVSADPLTVGESLSLKILTDTLFKVAPVDSSRLDTLQKVGIKAGQTFAVGRYGFMDGHLKVEIIPGVLPVGNFGYFYAPHVQLSKGSQVVQPQNREEPPDTQLAAGRAVILTETLLKTKPVDSASLPANQKLVVKKGQVLAVTGYASVAGHFRLSLAQEIPGFGQVGYIFRDYVQVQRNGKAVPYDPDALTLTVLKPTLFKNRLADSTSLKPEEKVNVPAGSLYGVSAYALAGDHLKVTLTEELPKFGNTGFVYTEHIQLRRGGRAFNPMPAQVELNVPYFSQRDNPRSPSSTCNVTSIAMVLYFYGLRPRWGDQLEDELLQWCLNKYGPGSQTDNGALSEMINAYGYKSSFSTTRKWSEIKAELVGGRPVVIGGMFTHSGHIVCVVGFNSKGYIINDPWGNALTGYSDMEGKKLLYPNDYMDEMCGPDGQIWAHFTQRK